MKRNNVFLTFSENKSLELDTIFIPVPDEYHWGKDGGANEKWLYIVPENYSLDEDHIDAAPFSFGIVHDVMSVQKIDESMLDRMEISLKLQGCLRMDLDTHRYIVNSDCTFMYQFGYVEDDLTFSMIKGFILTNVGMYQFHVYYNHGAEKDPTDDSTLEEFQRIAESWMSKTVITKAPIFEMFPNTTMQHVGDKNVMFIPSSASNENYKSISDIIGMDDSGKKRIFCINNEWTFEVAKSYKYKTDDEVQNKLVEGGLDITGSCKPLIIRAFKRDSGDYLLELVLNAHRNMFGKEYDMDDLRYDDRAETKTDGVVRHEIIRDDDDFVVDLSAKSIFPFGSEYEIRVRGENISPYNFTVTIPKDSTEDEVEKLKKTVKEIAKTIKKAGSTESAISTVPKKKESRKITVIDDPNFVISGTVVKKYKSNSAHVIIPQGITEIADNAFYGKALETVTFPNGLKSIGDNAFAGCDNLTAVVLPDSVEELGSRSFENCFSIEYVKLSSSLKYVGSYSFVDAHELSYLEIPEGVETIGNSAFSDCRSLKELVLPSTIKSLDAFAFKGCSSLTKVILPTGVETIGFTAFAWNSKMTYLYVPKTVKNIYDNLMDQSPFEGCSSLTIYGHSGSEIEKYARSHNIKFSIVTSVPKAVLKKIDPPSNSICHGTDIDAFEAEKHEEPKNSTTRAYNNFCYNDSTVHRNDNIKYITLTMDDVVAAHGELLSYEGDEKNVIFPEGITEIGDFFESSVLFENIVIPEGVTRIGERAFASQYRLKSIVLPSTLEVIDEEAFSECLLLESVTLPYGLTNIEKSAFGTCDSLKMIVIPDTVQTIGDIAFFGCGYLKNIFLQGEIDDVHEDAFFGINNDVVLHIQPDGDIEEYCESNYLKFDYKSAEEYVPEKEKRVAEKSSLSDFVIDEARVLKSYHGYAKIVEVPDNVTEIYLFAFAHHHEIEKVIISEGVEKIGGSAFSCCLSLNEVVLPTTLRTVGPVAFSECISLKKISFAPGLETLEGSLFHENTKDIYLPESVKNIDNNAIYSFSNQILHVPKGSVAEKHAKKHMIKFDNESDPMMQKYVEKVEAINRQKEEAERKAREEAERKAREEEAERQRIREENERKAREEEAERQRIREENERKAREEVERFAREQAQILKQREEFIASETEAAENQYQETVAELTAKFEKKDNDLTLQINELKKKLIQLEQELAGASFFAFSRKRQLKNEIQTTSSSITAMEEEKKILSGEHQIQLNDVQAKRENQLSSLPMRAVKKFPMPSKLKNKI